MECCEWYVWKTSQNYVLFFATWRKTLSQQELCMWILWKISLTKDSCKYLSNSVKLQKFSTHLLSHRQWIFWGQYSFSEVNCLNYFYTPFISDIPPLDVTALPTFLPPTEAIPTIQPYQVCKKLPLVKTSKAQGPDNVPACVLKECAYELAAPVTTIFSTSLATGVVPWVWKESNITSIPKIKTPSSKADVRPISLTPCLSKTLEDFVVSWMIEDVGKNIVPN